MDFKLAVPPGLTTVPSASKLHFGDVAQPATTIPQAAPDSFQPQQPQTKPIEEQRPPNLHDINDWKRGEIIKLLTRPKGLPANKQLEYLWKLAQLDQAAEKGEYTLPEETQAALQAWRRNPANWPKRVANLWNPGVASREEAVLKGPVEIKRLQTLAEFARKQVSEFEKARSLSRSDRDDTGLSPMEKWSRRFDDTKLDAIFWYLKTFHYNRIDKAFSPLKDDVPALPKEAFQAQFDELKAEYKALNAETGDEIVSIGKSLGVGSIGQVFLAETKQRGKVVVKVLRPDATPERLQTFLPYLTFLAKLQVKPDDNQEVNAAKLAQTMLNVIMDETNFEREADCARAMKAELERRHSVLKVPEVFVSSPKGLVMEYAGGTTLNKLRKENPEQARELLGKITPDVLSTLLVSPVKYYDFHAGNVMVKQEEDGTQTPYLIDFGRAALLDKGINLKFLDLMKSYYSYEDEDKLVKKLNKLISADSKKALTDEEKCGLVERVAESPLYAWANWSLIQAGMDPSEQEQFAGENLWDVYFEQAPIENIEKYNLQPLAPLPVSVGDINDIKIKIQSLFKEAFLTEPTANEERKYIKDFREGDTLSRAFSGLTPLVRRRMRSQKVLDKGVSEYSGKKLSYSDKAFKKRDIKQLSQEIDNDYEQYLPGIAKLMELSMEPDKQSEYKDALNQMLADPGKRSKLMHMIHALTQLEKFTKVLMKSWPRLKGLQEHQKQYLMYNLANALASEFKLESKDLIKVA